MTYWARENQSLKQHLVNCAEFAKVFASAWGCPEIAFHSGLVHDFGKYTKAFQEYLKKSLAGEMVQRGEVIHALQGARYMLERLNDQLLADMVGGMIAAHHNGLFDTIADGENALLGRLNKPEDKLHYEEAMNAFASEIHLKIDEPALYREILDVTQICQQKRLNAYFMLHLMTKVLYSCLVDADRCDAAGIQPDANVPDWDKCIQQLEGELSRYKATSPLNKVRTHISEQCQRAAGWGQGIYTLSVPTGGGKTLSGLRFALEHAKQHGLKRIIYIIPYLSILDQTASELRRIFADEGEDLILEHHSNFDVPQDDDDEKEYRLLASRWDAPIVLTTMVQFLETIYSNKASKLRKFHNMAESVLIFDEIQSLPIKCVHLFNEAVNFIHTFGQSTVLLCTATQPHLHNTERPVMLSGGAEVVELTPDEMTVFDRVRIQNLTKTQMSHEQIAILARKQLVDKFSTLVILNTKRDARTVYELCRELDDCDAMFLTTDLCPAHRLGILAKMKANVKDGSKKLTLCISTSMIEAGVDASFDCVIRAAAGMDSIIQAAGRCNRNAESETPRTVFVVDVEGERLALLPEVKDGKAQTARVFREYEGGNLLGREVMDKFYQYYFYNQRNQMDYLVSQQHTTIYDMLGVNQLGQAAYRNMHNREPYNGLPTAFQSAEEAFSVIEGGQIGIVVPYGSAMELVTAFQHAHNPREKMRILRQLQKYTISVFRHTLDELGGAVRMIDDSFYLLSKDHYDEQEYGFVHKSVFMNY